MMLYTILLCAVVLAIIAADHLYSAARYSRAIDDHCAALAAIRERFDESEMENTGFLFEEFPQ